LPRPARRSHTRSRRRRLEGVRGLSRARQARGRPPPRRRPRILCDSRGALESRLLRRPDGAQRALAAHDGRGEAGSVCVSAILAVTPMRLRSLVLSLACFAIAPIVGATALAAAPAAPPPSTQRPSTVAPSAVSKEGCPACHLETGDERLA